MKKKVRSLFVSVFVVLLSGSMAWAGLIGLSSDAEPIPGITHQDQSLFLDFSALDYDVSVIIWFNESFNVPLNETLFSFTYDFTPDSNSDLLVFSFYDPDASLNSSKDTPPDYSINLAGEGVVVSYDLSQYLFKWSDPFIGVQWGLYRGVLGDGVNTESSTPSAWIYNVRTDPVPEPATLILMAGGLIGLFGARRMRKQA